MTSGAEESGSLNLDKAGPRANSPEITYAHDGAVTAETVVLTGLVGVPSWSRFTLFTPCVRFSGR